MKKFALSIAVVGTLATPMVGCTTAEQTTAQRAAAGAVIGGTAAVLLERRNDGQCVYRERGTNRRIIAPCQ